MNSKNIKVRTDGDILREAYVISGFEVDGSEYIIYCIDRDDGVNDNIFMSKLTKNTDGTYLMRNIDNTSEKINVSSIVKSLVKAAVSDNDNDNYTNDVITVDGKSVKLFPVIINTEQSINNQNSYVASVKKSVTEVTKKYFNKESIASKNDDIFADEAKFAAEPVVNNQEIPVITEPVVTPTVAPAPVENTVVEEVQMPTLESTPVSEPVKTPVVDIPDGLLLQPEVEVNNVLSEPSVKTETPNLLEPTEPVVQNVTATTPEPIVTANVITPSPEPISNNIKPVELNTVTDATFIEPKVEPTPVANNVNSNVVSPEPVKVEAPIVNNQAMNIVSTPEVVNTVSNDKLVLDGSHESNLNSALGEISQAIPVSDIDAVKEFGVDEPVVNDISTGISAPVIENNSEPKKLEKRAGFANSKFFMFVALAFFFGSCIFLGYEVFNYFQIVK